MSSLTVPATTLRPTRRPTRAPRAQVVTTPAAASGRVRLTRRGRLVVVLFLFLALLVAGGSTWLRSPAAAGGTPTAPVAEQVTVRPGDTLWSIAARAVPGEDPRVTVARIMAMNGLESSAVQAGRALFVPAGG